MASDSHDRSLITLPTDLRALWCLLLEKGCLLATCITVCGLLGVFYTIKSARLFQATTTVQIETEQERLGNPVDRKTDLPTKEEVLKTIEQNLQSPALLQSLLHHPELVSDAAFLPRIQRPAADQRLRTALAKEISVSVRRGTRLIDVTVEDESPVLAQKLARVLVEEFLRTSSESRVAVSRDANKYLQDEADRLKARLVISENLLQQYKEEHRAVSLDEKQNIVVERLKELNGKVTTAKADRLRLETDRAQIEAMAQQPPERLLALPSIAGAEEVGELRRKISEKENELAASGYRPEHPRHVQTAGEVSELKGGSVKQ